MNDLVKRIREGIMDGWSYDYPCLDGVIAKEAADYIAEQNEVIAEASLMLKKVGMDLLQEVGSNDNRFLTNISNECLSLFNKLSKSNPNTPERNDE